MNISYISTYPPTRCGIGTYTNYLSQAVSRINNALRISIIAEYGARIIKDKLFETSPCFDRKEDYTQKISQAVTRFGSAIVHIQHEFAIFNPDGRFLNLLQELKKMTKIVLTLHTVHTNETNDWNIKGMSITEYNFRMSQLVDAIIVHQERMKAELVRQGVNGKLIYVIPHGTEILKQENKIEAMRRLELPENIRIILSFGFFGKAKRKELIVDALPEVLKKVPDAYVFFSGYVRDWVQEDFETRKLYEEKAKELGVRDHVIFAKRYIPDDEIYLVFDSSDVVVFPYFQEWYSGSGALHLAMGSFKPIVVSKIPKFEEVPREISNELVFDPNDSSSLAKILIKLLVDNDFREIIVGNIKRYALATSWDLIAKTHIQLYKTLVVGFQQIDSRTILRTSSKT
ncbi:MAG: glycosyltransferase [Deltaproteobacteria bacterium]|nr:glycosyltransferase [Deltaproteobacteria bacterium]